MKRIVLIRAGALGDTVLTLPALRALRSRYPEARLDVVGYPTLWELAGSLIDGISSIDRPLFAGLFSARAPADLRDWLADTGMVISWMVRDTRPALQTAVPRVVQVSPYPPPGVHATSWLLRSLDAPDEPFVPLQLSRAECAAGRTVADIASAVILHPGAGAGWKRWPAARFAALSDALRQTGHPVLVVEGPADAGALVAMRSHVAAPFQVLRPTSLRDLAALLAHARLFIGNDSGVTHLAAATGVRTLALFGPTDPACWRPLGNSRVLRACRTRAERQGQLRVCDDPACMESLSGADVLAAALTLISTESPPSSCSQPCR